MTNVHICAIGEKTERERENVVPNQKVVCLWSCVSLVKRDSTHRRPLHVPCVPTSYLEFLRNCHTVFQNGYIVFHSHQEMYRGIQLLCRLPGFDDVIIICSRQRSKCVVTATVG